MALNGDTTRAPATPGGTALAWLKAFTRLGPRESGSPAEAASAAWLAHRLQGLGYRVHVESFRAPSQTLYRGSARVAAGLLALLAFQVVLPLAGVTPLPLAAWLAPAAALLLVALFTGELAGSPWLNLDRILGRGITSANVVACPPAVRAGASGEGPAGGRVQPPLLVVAAHHDTQRASLLFAPALQPFLPVVLGLLGAVAAAGPLLLAWLAVAPAAPVPRWVAWVEAAALALVGGLFEVARRRGAPVEGANDNGSGVALALALAERLAPAPAAAGPRDVGGRRAAAEFAVVPRPAVWFLFTGAEEVGARGMGAFLDTWGPRLPRPGTVILVLDNLGGGRLRLLEAESLPGPAYPRHLRRLALAVARREGVDLTPWPRLLLPTDGLPALRRGYPALTLVGVDERGRIPNYHWHTDRLDRVDVNVLAEAERFLMALLPELVAEAARCAAGAREG